MRPFLRLTPTIYTDYYHQILNEGLYLASWWAGRPAKRHQHTSVMLELRTQSSPTRAIRVQVFDPAFSRADVLVQGMVGKTITSIDGAVPTSTRGNEYFVAEGITFSTGSRIRTISTHGNHLGDAPEKLETIDRIPMKQLVVSGSEKEVNPEALTQGWLIISRTEEWATFLGTDAEGGSAVMMVSRSLDHLWVEAERKLVRDRGLTEAVVEGQVILEVDKQAKHLAWLTPAS